MLKNKNDFASFKWRPGKRVKQIGVFVEYTQCAGIETGIYNT